MKRLMLFLVLFLAIWQGTNAKDHAIFRRMGTHDGLSNSQVNVIFKDSRGYLWFGTEFGLNRYDGFRFKNYLYQYGNDSSLPSDLIADIQEDTYGHLWIRTEVGYCIYSAENEKFDIAPNKWLQNRGMSGTPSVVNIDEAQNMWFAVPKGIYYYNVTTNKAYLFRTDGTKGNLPSAQVSAICSQGDRTVVTFSNGILAGLDGKSHKILWINKGLYSSDQQETPKSYGIHIDKWGNLWCTLAEKTMVWSAKSKKWFDSPLAVLTELGFKNISSSFLVKDLTTDNKGRTWIATDHQGIIMLDSRDHQAYNYLYDSTNPESVPDNTIQNLYVDNFGAVWVGTYKNGIAYYSDDASKFNTIYLGDICTITEDRQGNLWCGTNDSGIIVYNPATSSTHQYRMNETGLASDVVVSSLTDKDGSLWFGSFNGGLTHYKNGHFTSYRATGEPNSLAHNSVWALAIDDDGDLFIATLGCGLQVLNTHSGKFTTYNTENSKIGTDFVVSLSTDRSGNIIVGGAQDFYTFDKVKKTFQRKEHAKEGERFTSSEINQTLVDSRGLVWNATASGLTVFDPKTDEITSINLSISMLGSVACSIIEDLGHSMWVASDHGVSHITVSRVDDKWSFFVTSYNDIDGLQNRQFNNRSIYLTQSGNVVIGGQDGINIIPPQKFNTKTVQSRALFSGLVLFDHPLNVDEEYNGRIVLKEALADGGSLSLESAENAFTIQLATNSIRVPEKSRFLYRLKGFNDIWMMTSEESPSVTFTNLSFGNYTLEVKVVNRDGSISDQVSTLDIHIAPPAYLSIWAILAYIIIVLSALYYGNRFFSRRQKEKFQLAQVKREAEQHRRIDEMKLNFFTNISHELRTPLTLIISPLKALIDKEDDSQKRNKLELIHRNAVRLLNMVNEILDFRKMDSANMKLNAMTGDIVSFVKALCDSFDELSNKHISLQFKPSLESLVMLFDDDKMRKVMNNLLSNAFKFTPEYGRIDVFMQVLVKDPSFNRKEDMLEIVVADNGRGIPDDDKLHIFERFYQAKGDENQPYGGSGIGLNMVKTFVELHEGSVRVIDNDGGGSRFIIEIPIRHDVSAKSISHQVVTTKEKEREAQLLTPNETDRLNPLAVLEGSSNFTVLLVDDSDDFRAFMVDELSHYYNMTEAANGKIAWEMIQDRKPDVILSDVMMPEMDGNELCQLVKGNASTSDIPFIMLSARVAQEQKIEGMENGADDYITKPFSMDILRLRINNLIKWHQSGGSHNGKLEPKVKDIEITSVDEKMVQQATDYIEEHISDSDIKVESLSAAMGMSRVQLYKRLVSVTGTTPSEFIRNIRLQHAEQLLRKSQLSVSEIAYQVGFNNPRYFTKYFSDAYGMTPSQYKKEKEER